jgi:DNA-binding NtrC family response regulator
MESLAAPSNSIMIINDNLDLLNLFKDALQREGFDPYTFTDPSFALRKIKSDPNEFSLAIINYSTQLRNASNGSFANEVKAINKNIKVLLTSGFNFSTVDISQQGYDKFIQLPVRLSVLVSAVKEVLNREAMPN